MVAIGGALVFNFFHNEPLWARWLLGYILFYLGGPVVIVGAAIHFFGEAANNAASKNAPIAANAHR